MWNTAESDTFQIQWRKLQLCSPFTFPFSFHSAVFWLSIFSGLLWWARPFISPPSTKRIFTRSNLMRVVFVNRFVRNWKATCKISACGCNFFTKFCAYRREEPFVRSPRSFAIDPITASSLKPLIFLAIPNFFLNSSSFVFSKFFLPFKIILFFEINWNWRNESFDV